MKGWHLQTWGTVAPSDDSAVSYTALLDSGMEPGLASGSLEAAGYSL